MSGEFRRPEVRRVSSATTPAVRPADLAPAPASGPRHFATVQMVAVGCEESAPRSSGRMLDDAIDFDFDADGALELDCLPSSHSPRVEQPRQTQHEPPSVSWPTPQATPTRPRGVLPPAPPWPMASAGPRRTSSSTHKAAGTPARPSGTRAAFVAFAGFGDVPLGMFALPGYAVRVVLRRRELRGDMARARVRRSHDLALYEGALRTADDAAVRNGFLMIVMALVVAGLSVAALVHLLR